MKKLLLYITLFSLVSIASAQYAPTPNIGLEVPVNGSSNWNIPLNYNFNKLDQLLSGQLSLPGLTISGNIVVGGSVTANSFIGAGGAGLATASVASQWSPVYYLASPTGNSFAGVVPFTGLAKYSATGPPSAATSVDIKGLLNGQTGCSDSTTAYNPQTNTCISTSGNPGGANQDVQFNLSSTFGADHGVFTYNNSTHTLFTQNSASSGALTGSSIDSFNPNLDLASTSGHALNTNNYVQADHNGVITNGVFPQRYPYNGTLTIPERFAVDSNGLSSYTVYQQSGGRNYGNQGNGTVNEKPNTFGRQLDYFQQTPGQGGGFDSWEYIHLGNGDTAMQTRIAVATGCSDGDDECAEVHRDALVHDPNRFGMQLTSITGDARGNYTFRGTRDAGYTELTAEGLPFVDLSKDLNPSSAGNMTDLRGYGGDSDGLVQVTVDNGINLPTLIGNSSVSYTTSAITATSYPVTPVAWVNTTTYNVGDIVTYASQTWRSFADANLGNTPGASKQWQVAGLGIMADQNGKGAFSNVTVGVQNASVYAVSLTIPVCFGSPQDNFELTYITAINTGANTVTLEYVRDQHGIGEMLAQGGGCGWGVAAYADDKAPSTLVDYGLDNYGLNGSTLHNVYPVEATIGGKLIVYANAAATVNLGEMHTGAYANNTPMVPGTLTVTMSGGALSSLAVNGTANYFGNVSSFGTWGQISLAYPTITFSVSGGSCTTLPSVTVKGYAHPLVTQLLPILSQPGDSGWNAGAGCTGTVTATMQSVYPNPYHLYPLTMSFRDIDPNNNSSTGGNYLMTQAINAANWAVGDHTEIDGWFNQYVQSQQHYGVIYGGKSGKVGTAMQRLWEGTTPDEALQGLINASPTSQYWSASGPSAGVAFNNAPVMEANEGSYSGFWHVTIPLATRFTSYGDGSGAGYGTWFDCFHGPKTDANKPCDSHIGQLFDPWLFTATTGANDSMQYDTLKRTMTWSNNFIANVITSNTDGFFKHGVLVGGDPSSQSNGFAYSLDGINALAGSYLCNPYISPYLVSFIDRAKCNVSDANESIEAGFVKANWGSVTNNVSVGLPLPVPQAAAAYTGAAGSITRRYYFVSYSAGTGIFGSYNLVLPTGTQFVPATTLNNTATLGGGNSVTITCPTVQSDYNSGDGYEVITDDSTPLVRSLGICTGASITDTGSGTTLPGLVGGPSWNGIIGAGHVLINAGGALGFLPINSALVTGAIPAADTWIVRGASGQIKIGKTKGASDGDIEAATWNGKPIVPAPAHIQIVLPTASIPANHCWGSAEDVPGTVALTGTVSTSTFTSAFTTSPFGVTGYGGSSGLSLSLVPDATPGILDYGVCNGTATAITPGAMTINVGLGQ